MHCVVTAGPTFEPLDRARRLTNFSTGKLGIELGNHLTARGCEVTLLVGEQAVYPGRRHARTVEVFTTTSSLAALLQSAAGASVQAVFHAAAVSDFSFGRVWRRDTSGCLEPIESGKFSTRDGTLLAELKPTPKIIGRLREWFPRARLIGWKYEVEGKRLGVLQAGLDQIQANRTDACVANGPAYGPGFGLICPGTEPAHIPDQEALFAALELLLRGE